MAGTIRLFTIIKYFIIVGFVLSAFLHTVSAQTLIPQTREQKGPMVVAYDSVNPKDGFKFILKRLREKAGLGVLSFFPGKKADYYKKVLDSRLAEMKYIVDNKDLNYIEKGSWRYSTIAGQYTEFILKKNLANKKKETVDLLTKHLVAIETFQEAFDPTTAEWRLVKQDADYLRIYISQLSD